MYHIMSKSYPTFLNLPYFFETVNHTFEKVIEVWISNGFLKFISQISIEFRIGNILLQKFLQTDMIFFSINADFSLAVNNLLRLLK